MFKFVTYRKLHQLLKTEYERGLSNGYKYGYQMGQIEAGNRAIILGKTSRGIEFAPQSPFKEERNSLAQEILEADKETKKDLGLVNQEIDQILKDKGF